MRASYLFILALRGRWQKVEYHTQDDDFFLSRTRAWKFLSSPLALSSRHVLDSSWRHLLRWWKVDRALWSNVPLIIIIIFRITLDWSLLIISPFITCPPCGYVVYRHPLVDLLKLLSVRYSTKFVLTGSSHSNIKFIFAKDSRFNLSSNMQCLY